MTSEFNWLHFSNLHFGQPDQSALWPNIRKALFHDLKRLHDRAGPWHAVLFSGDMVYSGQAIEFEQFERDILGRIWEELTRLGSGDAVLLAVPGNHDLQRSTTATPSAALRQLLRPGGFLEVADEVWNNADSEYRKVVDEAFEAYRNWWANTQFRRNALIKDGAFPGDFAATLTVGSRKIGVVGLNTAFLQLSDGNFCGQLEWDIKQLQAVTGDAEDWAIGHDARILMTHHGPHWLSERARDDYPEIYPSSRFGAHLFGHMHENDILASHHGGCGMIRQWQSASLFGLEKFGQPPVRLRKHGFVAGRIKFDDNGATIRCWPRTATKDHAGWRSIPDHQRGTLEDDEGIRSENFEIVSVSHPTSIETEPSKRDITPEAGKELIPIETALAIEPAKQRLRNLPRFRANVDQAHRSIRKEEQASFEAFARKYRVVCLISDWGLGKEGFLGSALERLVSPLSKADVFRVNCEEAGTVDQLLTATALQFGISFQEFCALAAPLTRTFLLLDEIPRELLQGEKKHHLLRLLASTLDYCPNLCVVVTTRQTSESNDFLGTITLKPLDPFDIRNYLNNHAQSVPNLELVHEDSAQALQAEGVIVSTTKSGYDLERELSRLEQLARNRKYFTVANNFALELASIGAAQ